jgi:hypothetical protein
MEEDYKDYGMIITEEMEKCKNSPYYFATKYIMIGGVPFRTYMDEDTFNGLFKKDENL